MHDMSGCICMCTAYAQAILDRFVPDEWFCICIMSAVLYTTTGTLVSVYCRSLHDTHAGTTCFYQCYGGAGECACFVFTCMIVVAVNS